MSDPVRWRSTERLAWTVADGPGRPPGGVRPWYVASSAVVLGCALGVILFTDSLCPEHRLWVRLLGAVGVAVSLAAFAALVRGSAAAPVLTLAGAVAGVGIGALDALHAPLRGSLVLFGFLALTLMTAWPLWLEWMGARWARRVASEMPSSSQVPLVEANVDVVADPPPTPARREEVRAES
jgi:hypothetical protein